MAEYIEPGSFVPEDLEEQVEKSRQDEKRSEEIKAETNKEVERRVKEELEGLYAKRDEIQKRIDELEDIITEP